MSVLQCEHILDAGTQCGSPAVKNHKFCFFHIRLNQRPKRLNDGSVVFILRDLTCVESIQIAVSNVLHALNDGLIDSKKANSLYRGLSLALSALRFKLAQQKYADKESSSVHPFARILSLMPDNINVTKQAEAPECGADIPVRHADTTNDSPATTETDDTTSPDPQIPNGPMAQSLDGPIKALKRIIRLGPKHPLFRSSARQLDAHIVRVANASIEETHTH